VSDKAAKAKTPSGQETSTTSPPPGDAVSAPASTTPVSPPVPASPVVTPAGDQEPEPLPQVTDEELAEVAAATVAVLDTPGGKALEILLSPAVKKPRSRVSPPTSPQELSQEAIALRLKNAEERKKSIENERVKNISEQLAKISVAQHKKEEVEKEKSEKIQETLEAKLAAADEKKAKVLEGVRDKVSEHMTKIERAQKELETSLEAARLAAETSLTEKMDKNEELKAGQMEDMLKKIKEHQEHVSQVRNNQEEKLKPYVEELQCTIKAKEERAREILAQKDAELRGKLAEQNRRAEVVRQNRERLQQEDNQTNESA